MSSIFNTEHLVITHEHDAKQTLTVETESGFAFEKRLDGWNVIRLTKTQDGHEPVTIEFGLPPEDLETLAAVFMGAASEGKAAQLQFFRNNLVFARAGADCIAGLIGAVEFEFVQESPRNVPYLYLMNIRYMSDVPGDEGTEAALLYTVEEVEVMVPPAEHLFWEFVTSYVGGRHQYTNSIALKFKNVPEAFHQIVPTGN